MNLQGYKCNQCGTGFEDLSQDDSNRSGEIKCPQCSSLEVTESESVSEFLELLEEMGRTGG